MMNPTKYYSTHQTAQGLSSVETSNRRRFEDEIRLDLAAGYHRDVISAAAETGDHKVAILRCSAAPNDVVTSRLGEAVT